MIKLPEAHSKRKQRSRDNEKTRTRSDLDRRADDGRRSRRLFPSGAPAAVGCPVGVCRHASGDDNFALFDSEELPDREGCCFPTVTKCWFPHRGTNKPTLPLGEERE